MAEVPTTYNYGTPPHDQTYTSVPYHKAVANIQWVLSMMSYEGQPNKGMMNYEGQPNKDLPLAEYNVCFLNRYDNEQNQLGWHSDDSPGMLHTHPIAVVSFGEPREIWVREKGASGVVPAEDRYLLGDGSLFIMPPGFQLTHQHRIPKGGKKMGPRISLTFRRYVP
jgi:alkylated DNA repair dioxygenase AlkB